MDEKAFEQCQQMQKDSIEEARSEREAARERTNDHRRQLEEGTRELQQKLEKDNLARNADLERRDKDLETERAKIKEERERAAADIQNNTQEHQERIKMKTQEHEKHVERRYKEDGKAAQEAKQGRKELRDGAKEYNDSASVDHLRNVDTQKDSLIYTREQQKGQIDRKIGDMNQTKGIQLKEQTKTEQEIETMTTNNRDTLIETLQLQINSSMASIDIANKASKTGSHVMAYDSTLVRCIATGLICVKESGRVKLQLSNLISELETPSEACSNPTAVGSKNETSNQPLNEIQRMRNFIKNCCEKALSPLDELQSIRSNSISSLSTNASLSADVRKTYKNYINQLGNIARTLHDTIYTIKSNMDSRSPLKITNLEKLDKELKNGIKEFNDKVGDSPDAEGIDDLREQFKMLQQEVNDSKNRVAKINQRESEKTVKDSADRPAEIDQRESEELDTSAQGNATQDGDE